jgi:hypothetical protein
MQFILTLTSIKFIATFTALKSSGSTPIRGEPKMKKPQKKSPPKKKPQQKKKPQKKKPQKKKSPKLPIATAGATTRVLRTALASPAAAAPAKPCLPLPAAVLLVRSCSKADPSLPLSTPLNQVFPSPTDRNSFCQCVADGVPIDRSEIPCGATNTLQDVVDAITCS